MTVAEVVPFVFDGVELYPPDSHTVIGSEMVKGGGTTKTTNCIMTAFALVALGFRVRVVSYDREHSSVSWADKGYTGSSIFQRPKVKALPWPDDLEVEQADSVEELFEWVHDYDGDFVIIDGGPADFDSVQVVAALCHHVVLPMEPGPLVLEQAPVTAELVREVEREQGRLIDLRVLLVRINIITRVATVTKAALGTSDITVMEASIGDHTAIKEQGHQVPRRLYGWEKVIVELLGDKIARPIVKETEA